MRTDPRQGPGLDISGGLDVIGDVHGHAAELLHLLGELGYRKVSGRWTHRRGRRAFFVGDLVDRGPWQLLSVQIARELVEDGMAGIVMGNHEFNAIAWATPDPDRPGEYLRTRTGADGEKHLRQHRGFLVEVGGDPERHAELVRWFLDLPLWCDLGAVRIVHACWDPASMVRLSPRLRPGNRLGPELVVSTNRACDADHRAIEHLLKGPEVALPDGIAYRDKDGHDRTEARFAWWDPAATTYPVGAVIPTGARTPDGAAFPDLSGHPFPTPPVEPYRADVPVFVGHYWRVGSPAPLGGNVVCVDYSVAAGGQLVACRWDPGRRVDELEFVTV